MNRNDKSFHTRESQSMHAATRNTANAATISTWRHQMRAMVGMTLGVVAVIQAGAMHAAAQSPGGGKAGAKAVRVRLTSSDGQATTFVNHEVKVGPRWRWVLNDSALKAFQAGKCPST